MINPKASAHDLEILVSDRAHWDLLDEVRDHPAAWPALIEWIDRAQMNPDTAGAAPEPPDPEPHGLLHRFHHTRTILEDPTEPSSVPAAGPEPPDSFEELAEGLEAEPVSTTVAASPIKKSDPQPAKSFRLPLPSRKLIVVIAAVTLLLLAGSGGTRVVMQQREQNRIERIAADKAEQEKAYTKARSAAKTLMKKIDSSPVADEKTVRAPYSKLETTLKSKTTSPDHTKKVNAAAKALSSAFSAAITTKSTEIRNALTTSISSAADLASAPASDDHTKMDALISRWKNRKIGEENLSDAIVARTELDSLVGSVRGEKMAADQAAAAAAAAQAQSRAQSQSTPSQRSHGSLNSKRSSGSSTQKRTSPQPSTGSSSNGSKSWSVPSQTPQGSLPDHL